MVGIVILNYNNVEDTVRCVDSVHGRFPAGAFKLCIVDNASEEAVRKAVAEAVGDRAVFIQSAFNSGYARGNNLGLEFFDADEAVDKVMILNNDVIITEDILTPLSEYLDKDASCGVVAPLLHSRSGDIDLSCARRFKTSRDLLVKSTSLGRLGFKTHEHLIEGHPELLERDHVEIGLPSGSCLMLRKSDFASAGFFDPATFLYFEEDILCCKLREKGLRAVLLPKVSAIHLGAATTSASRYGFLYSCYRQSMLHYVDNYSSMSAPLRRFIRFRTWIAMKIKSL